METLLKPVVAAPLCLAAALCFAASAKAGTMSAEVPAAIAAPAGHNPVMTLKGVGLLTYECRARAGAADAYEWVFTGPNAALQDTKGMHVGKYYGGPTWEHSDGSKLTGKQLAIAPAGAGAIPLQLVQANSTGTGAFSGVTYIQRVNTVGGVAPASPCNTGMLGAKQTVGYSADYVFFKPAVLSIAHYRGVQRTIDLQTDLAGIQGKDGVVLTVHVAPGAAAPKHYHPGHELAYVLEGSMVLEIEGKPPVTLKAGESFHIPPRVVHSAHNASSNEPLRVVVFGVFDKAQPDTILVK